MAERIESWYHKLSDALHEARLRQMPILEVVQPKWRKPLYHFGKPRGNKKYYVVTSAPKTLLAYFARQEITAKQLPDKLMARKAKSRRRVSV